MTLNISALGLVFRAVDAVFVWWVLRSILPKYGVFISTLWYVGEYVGVTLLSENQKDWINLGLSTVLMYVFLRVMQRLERQDTGPYGLVMVLGILILVLLRMVSF